MNRRTLTLGSLSMLAAMAGCVEVHSIPEHDGGPPANSDESVPADPACRVVSVVAGDTPLAWLGVDGTVQQTRYGSWIALRHPADVAATVHVELLDPPNASAVGWLSLLPGATSDELVQQRGAYTGSFSTRLYAPEEHLFLGPTGTSFRVSVCYEVRDPFPTCSGVSGPLAECPGHIGHFGTADSCACTPGCLIAADCPIPSTGDALRECVEPGHCVLVCDEDSPCPDGQVCTPFEFPGLSSGSICMTAL